MGIHRVSHQAWENQMLLGEVVDWQLHANHDSSPLSSKGHTLGKNINNEDSDISPPQTMANFYTSACWWVEMQSDRGKSEAPKSNSDSGTNCMTFTRTSHRSAPPVSLYVRREWDWVTFRIILWTGRP